MSAADRTDSDAAPAEPAPGSRLGKYRVIGRLGRGGMGVVYRAEDVLIAREVAVKPLPPALSADPASLERFLREAKAAGRLNHANAVHLYGVEQHEGAYFLVMELVAGGSLQQRLQQSGRLPWREAASVAAGMCRVLAAAHAAGMVHRDIKPANILMAADGTPKLADFGLAKAGGDSSAAGVTGTGVVVGTPWFMSPEQCESRSCDGRSDLYSLGMTLYALLTGRPPYSDRDPLPVQLMFAHVTLPTPDPRAEAPDVPAALVEVLQRATAKDPAARYPDAEAMSAALEAVLSGEPTGAIAELARATRTTGLTAVAAASPTMSVTVRRAAPPRRPAGVPAWIPFAAAGGLAVVAAGLWIGVVPKAEPPPKPKPVTKGPRPIVEPTDAAPEPPVPEPPVSEPPPDTGPKPQVPEGPAPVLTLNAHQGAVNALGFAPDGRQLVTGGAEGVVKVWKLPADAPAVRLDFPARSVAGVEWRTPERLFVGLGDGAIVQIDGTNPTAGKGRLYQAHAGPVTSVIEYGEGMLLSVGRDRLFRWTFFQPEQAGQVSGRQLPGEAVSLAFAGDRWSVGLTDGRVMVGEIGQGQLPMRQTHRGPVRAVEFAAGQLLLASGGDDGVVRLWDTSAPRYFYQHPEATLQVPRELAGHDGPVTSLSASPVSDLLASGGADGTVRLWSLPEGRPVAVLRHGSPVRAVLFQPARSEAEPRRWLVSAAEDGTVKAWDWSAYAGWKLLAPDAVWTAAGQTGITDVAWSPDGASVVSAAQSGVPVLWNSATGTIRARLAGHPDKVAAAGAAFTDDGSQVVTVDDGGGIRRWRTDDGSAAGSPVAAGFAATGRPVLSANAATLVGVVSDAKTGICDLRAWDTRTGGLLAHLPRLPGHISALSLSHDGRSAAAQMGGRGIDILTFRPTGTAATLAESDSFDMLDALRFDPAGRTVRGLSVDGRMCVWAADGRLVARTPLPCRGRFAVSPDGRRGAFWVGQTRPNDWVEIRDPATGALQAVLSDVGGGVGDAAFSPDGRRLLVGGADGRLRVFVFPDP